ncbi:MAG TPA: S16 family serine protease [Tepidisphaeraceae bacterium]|nr:S16 family serine protease [Tepidisphaeraceae bacterium]
MKLGLFRGWAALFVCLVAHWAVPRCLAAGANDAPVVVSYSEGDTQLGVVQEGTKFYIDDDYRFGPVTAEMFGLQFTKRRFGGRGLVTIDIPAGVKVDLMIGNGGLGGPSRDAATALGFTAIAYPKLLQNGKQELAAALYSQTFAQAKRINIPCVGFLGVVVLAPHLTIKSDPIANAPPSGIANAPQRRIANVPSREPEMRRQRATEVEDDTAIPGPAAPIKRLQSEIKALYVQEQPSGEMFGLASELILTATPGSRPGHTPVLFVSEVGPQMTAVLDDVLRAIWLTAPKWAASKVELSFEDRYTPKDGGSIGAAIGTLIQSMLQGFAIDDKVAITGDVTADAKIRHIGGVAAKIRGATAAECRIVIVPASNYDQVADAMVYEGRSLITNIQVLGAGTLEEATAVARTDRAPKLKEATEAFDSIAADLKTSPEKVHLPEYQTRLKHIVELAPDHLSARLLLLISQNKQPRTMSAAASIYYTMVGSQQAMPDVFIQLWAAQRVVRQSSAAVGAGLTSLVHIRGKVDPKVLPFVDAMIGFIQASAAANTGRGNPRALEARRQQVYEALSQLQTDRTLMEKMLHEGI